MDLSGLARAIEELDAADAAASACGEDLVTLFSLRARLDAMAARAAASFEAADGYDRLRNRLPDGPGLPFPPWSCGRDGAG